MDIFSNYESPLREDTNKGYFSSVGGQEVSESFVFGGESGNIPPIPLFFFRPVFKSTGYAFLHSLDPASE